MKLLTETNTTLLNLGVLLLRAATGIIFFGLGAGKVFGWFGLPALELTLQFYGNMGIPALLAYLSIFTEFIGGFLLIVGLLTRPAAFAIMINMLMATIVTLPMGFFIAAVQLLSLMVSAVTILLTGPMAYSIDYLLLRRGEAMPDLPERDEIIRTERR
jgi:putative oxidoreductase